MGKKALSAKKIVLRNMAERIEYLQTGKCSDGLARVLQKYPMYNNNDLDQLVFDMEVQNLEDAKEDEAENVRDVINDTLPKGFHSLPLEVLLMILYYAQPHSLPHAHIFETQLKSFWRLRGVNRQFRNALDSDMAKKFKRPSVGVKIIKKVVKNEDDKDMVIVYIHGAKGSKYPSQCIHISNLKRALWPCYAGSHFIVFGFEINETLLNILSSVELGKVLEFRFHDIQGVNLPAETATKRLREFACELKSANVIQFLMSEQFADCHDLFRFEVPFMEREEHELSNCDLESEYNWKRAGLNLRNSDFTISSWDGHQLFS